MKQETLINVIDLDSDELSDFVVEILSEMNGWGYDYQPDGGYSIFTRTDFIESIFKDMCKHRDVPYESVKLDLPHGWTVIRMGGDVFP